MSKLILPKTYIPDSQLDAPLIFLAGPIRSAPNWQSDAVTYLFSKEPNLIIASPRWERIKFEASKYVVFGDENIFYRQREWERNYLDIASKTGAILFWLPKEEKHDCEKVYGAMTRVELGEWMINYNNDNSVRLCIGTDGMFPEFSPIADDLETYASNIRVKNTLEETCDEAIRLTKG